MALDGRMGMNGGEEGKYKETVVASVKLDKSRS
jgi:hypothetical protein